MQTLVVTDSRLQNYFDDNYFFFFFIVRTFVFMVQKEMVDKTGSLVTDIVLIVIVFFSAMYLQ